MKARKVKGLDPDAPMAECARRIVRVRLDELYSFAPAVLDPDEVQALHDMRIASKRLRYVLEVTEPCFGRPARRAAKEARALQDVLGEIHDCDEALPTVEAHLERLRAQDADAVRSAAAADGDDVGPEALRAARNRSRYRGLETLVVYLRARREFLYGRFVERWSRLERKGFREELERALAGATLERAVA